MSAAGVQPGLLVARFRGITQQSQGGLRLGEMSIKHARIRPDGESKATHESQAHFGCVREVRLHRLAKGAALVIGQLAVGRRGPHVRPLQFGNVHRRGLLSYVKALFCIPPRRLVRGIEGFLSETRVPSLERRIRQRPLLVVGQREQHRGLSQDLAQETVRDAVILQVKEADGGASVAQGRGDLVGWRAERDGRYRHPKEAGGGGASIPRGGRR